MIKENMAIREATVKWVNGFNEIPQQLIVKAYFENDNIDDIQEVTPIVKGDYVWSNALQGQFEVYEVDRENDKLIVVDYEDVEVELDIDSCSKEDYDYLPMWGTMWTFGDGIEDYWLENQDGLQKMADCGFRIYETDDLGYLFGIDGAGYSFMENHFIPLYKARGLRWHEKV